MLLFAHLFNSFTYSHLLTRFVLICANFFEWFLTMIFHLVVLHTTRYYICILYTVCYIRHLCMLIFPHCMFTVFSFLRAAFFFCALFPLSLDLFEYDSQTGQFMNHSYSTCCTSFETPVHFSHCT